MDLKSNNGFTLIELMVTMALMAILGVIIVSMLRSGNIFYRQSYKESEGESEARIAMSYVTTKIRENDIKDGIKLDTDGSGFKVKDSADDFNLHIYFEGNKLKEKQLDKEPVEIANIDSFNIEKTAENNFKITVGYTDKHDNKLNFEEILALKCTN